MNARVGAVVSGFLALAACSGAGGSRAELPADPSKDAVRLTTGEVLQGRIVEEGPSHVSIESGGRVLQCPRATVYQVAYSPESYRSKSAPARAAGAEAPRGTAEPPASWYPRRGAQEPVEQKEVLWYDAHLWTECLGVLADEHRRVPEIVLFAEPGGKIVLQDSRQWGYHAHVFPGDRLLKPAGKPGLAIELPKEEGALPDGVAFVSPAQEVAAGIESKRTSYAPPDALYARVRPRSQAEGMLASQPFAGGKPAETATGKLWAFAVPRNATQFLVYLFDAERRHGQILRGAFAAYGETILAADLMVDVEGADGVAIGRVLVVPFPDGLSADGPAPEPVTIYAGPVEDPSPVARVAVPPRVAIQLPARTPATRADVLVAHYDVARGVPESVVLAYGTGRPVAGGDAKVVSRELTVEKPDELVKIDLSSLAEERFPAVVWFSHRRTFAWRGAGGYLPRVAALEVPPRREGKLTRVKKNVPVPHVLPLYFGGPKPALAAAGSADPGAGVAGGMSAALMQDALAREAGRFPFSIAPSLGVRPGEGGGNLSSVTNVYILAPQHIPADGGGAGPNLSGVQYSNVAGWPTNIGPGMPGTNMWNSPVGTIGPGSVYRDSSGAVLYDPASGRTTYQGVPGAGLSGLDPVRNTPAVTFTRRNRP